jgi:hypothetical protein
MSVKTPMQTLLQKTPTAPTSAAPMMPAGLLPQRTAGAPTLGMPTMPPVGGGHLGFPASPFYPMPFGNQGNSGMLNRPQNINPLFMRRMATFF